MPLAEAALPEGVRLRHLGQSGFRIGLGAITIYIDPYLSDYVEELEGPKMRRLRPAPMSPAEVGDADWVLVSHAHADHCDPLTLGPIAAHSASSRFLAPYEVADILSRQLAIAPARIHVAAAEWIALDERTRVLPIPAAHRHVERNELGQPRCVGFLIESGGVRIYHSGDCSVEREVLSALEGHGPIDLALLPVNECNYYRDAAGIIGNMSIRDAFLMAGQIGAKAMVPMHYDMFAPNCAYEEEIRVVYERTQPPFRLLFPSALESR